jgi:hypothetical protein
MIACSSKVVGASTGSLMSVHLPMEARSGGIVGDETGDGVSKGQWRSIASHFAFSDRMDVFFRHCFRHRDSADEESDRFGEGEMEEGQREKSP